MAIDTTNKRRSLVGYGLPFRIGLPLPDGTISVGDRLNFVGLYSGITPSNVVAAMPEIIADSVYLVSTFADDVFLGGTVSDDVYYGK